MNWLDYLRSLSPSVEVFVQAKGSNNPLDYQVKWLALDSLLARGPVGRLRYLPDKSYVRFSIRIP